MVTSITNALEKGASDREIDWMALFLFYHKRMAGF